MGLKQKRQRHRNTAWWDKYGACNANTRVNIASWKMDRDRRCICYKHGKMFRSNVCLPENSWPWSAFFGGNFFGICKIIYWAAPLLDANHPPRMIILSVWNEDPNCENFPIKPLFPFLASSGSTSYIVSLIINFVCLFVSRSILRTRLQNCTNLQQENLVIPFEVLVGEIMDHYYYWIAKFPMSHRGL